MKDYTEKWLPVVGYEGLYEVSNMGNVRKTDGKIPKQFIEPLRGYMKVSLRKDKKNKSVFVHRLVAMAFIPNPNNYPIINHKDEDKTNNLVDNLEWCTYQYNNTYGSKREKQSIITKNFWKTGVLNRDKQIREGDLERYKRNKEIIERYKKGGITQRQLAKIYGITQEGIFYILHYGKTEIKGI